MIRLLWVPLAVLLLVMLLRSMRRPSPPLGTEVHPPRTEGRTLEHDRQVLKALRGAGADLTKSTHVLFYLYFSTRESAEQAAASAATSQLSGRVSRGADDTNWLLLLEGQMVPTELAINSESTRLSALAQSFGGEYDGWEAAVTS